MFDQLAALVLDEGKWLTASMLVALLATAVAVRRARAVPSPRLTRGLVVGSMTLFFGVTIGTMALGHLLAVTVKLVTGSLVGSVAYFYAIGVALAVPAAFVIVHGRRLIIGVGAETRATVALNAWLSLTLLALGIHNLPLAAPGLVNVGYVLHARPRTGWMLVGLAVLVNAVLFAGSLVFLFSGQSFEQFSGVN